MVSSFQLYLSLSQQVLLHDHCGSADPGIALVWISGTVRLSVCLVCPHGPDILVPNSWTSQPDIQVLLVDVDQLADTVCTIYW